jgi:hypothetical protein
MTATEPFPSLPPWLVAGRKNIPARVRPFGAAPEHLGVDFHLARRPELVTDLLALCCFASDGAPADHDVLLDLPVGIRICALMVLAAASDPAALSWHVRCGSDGCAQQNEFELTTAQLVALAQERLEEQTIQVSIGATMATLRRPTARDQLQWLEADEDMSDAMLRAVVMEPRLDELRAAGMTSETIAIAVDAAMDSFDPLLSFHVRVPCPGCGAVADVAPDLAGTAIERLSRAQHAAIADVHRLASRYHWSEIEILNLPQWRRHSYLDLIEGGA